MRKLLPALFAVFACISIFVSCNKGDDNPFGDYKCTCFVAKSQLKIVPPDDTVVEIIYDTVYLKAHDMDKNTATSFCTQAQAGYTDTLGSSAKCNLK